MATSSSLRAVEREIGVSNAYLSQLENGKIQKPSPVVLHKLSILYEISYSEILHLAGYPVPNIPGEETKSIGFSSRVGPISKEEEAALVEYLEFLRSKRK